MRTAHTIAAMRLTMDATPNHSTSGLENTDFVRVMIATIDAVTNVVMCFIVS